MKKCILLFLVLIMAGYNVACTGEISSTYPEEKQIIQMVENYNAHTKLQTTTFNGSIPIEQGLFFFSYMNGLANEDNQYVGFLTKNTESDLPTYKIPKEIVEKYLLEHFYAIDYSQKLVYSDYENGEYTIIAGGMGHTPTKYSIMHLQQKPEKIEFIVKGDDEKIAPQKFVLRLLGGNWVIYSVQQITD